MINNFSRITVRNILKNKGFTLINVVGLAAGLAATLLIVLWIEDELSYDRFNRNGDHIFRVEENQFYSGERYHVTVTPHPSGPVWAEKIPEIKMQTRMNFLPRILFRKDDLAFYESSVIAADSGLFRIFTLPLLMGDPVTALNSPHSIVLSEKLASKYFGDENPVGSSLTLENKVSFIVTGVMKEIPDNSIFSFEAVIPYSFLKEIGAISDSWGNNSIFTFVLLENNADIDGVNKKLTDVVLEYNPETTTKYLLFPFLDIHLHAQFGFTERNGPMIAIYIFSLIAIFILLIACMNFINLSTAKASNRAKEIAIKKVTGASRKSLTVQFMFESFVLVIVSMFLAVLLVGSLLGMFNNISGKNFSFSDLITIRFIVSFVLVGLLAGFLSGFYPALYLSSIKPVAILKGDTVTGKGNGALRKILVVVQFTMSILIAVSATFMYLQLKYLQNIDLGFDKNNLITIPMAQNMKGKYYSLKSEWLKETLIQGVTASMQRPLGMGSNGGGASWEGKDPEKNVLIGQNVIDYDYMSTMKMALASGRDFSREFPGDFARDTTGNFLVNEEVVRLMDIGDPVGKNFSFMGIKGKIVGVMKNFHFKSADQAIEPMAFAVTDTSYLNYILVRLTPGNIPGSLQSVEKVWKEIVPEYPLQYTFVDQDYDNMYRSQLRLTGLLKYFTILSLIIACMGLYGLSAYSAERRTNEIGIRKVMGADVVSVMYTMAKEFMILIIISLVIAIPLGWIIVEKLLNEFASRINIHVMVFVIISVGAMMVALLTISFQSYRASGVNPADALKIE
jgi:putative ABC transport system permease protein